MAFFGKEKVVVALGGGGSRGLAHLGVLQVLEEQEIPIHGIVGTSVGAIVGAAYALSPDAHDLTTRTLEYLRSDKFQNDTFRRMMFGANEAEQNFVSTIFSGIRKSLNFTGLVRRPSIFPGERLSSVIADLIEDKQFSDLQIPFAVPALDMKQPIEVLLSEGSLRTAVTASCSLPGFFPPVDHAGMLLADVGVVGSVPVDAARELMSSAVIVAIDLSTELEPIDSVDLGWDAIMRVENFAAKKLNELELSRADVVIRPQVGTKYWSDFSELQRLVDSGRESTEAAIDQIRARLKGFLGFIHR